MLQAGDLDRRITIDRASVMSDDFGGEVLDWVSVATVWASVEWVKDGEKFRNGEVGASVDVRFVIRWGLGVTVTDRVVYEDREYDIRGVKELGRHEGQEISATARAE